MTDLAATVVIYSAVLAIGFTVTASTLPQSYSATITSGPATYVEMIGGGQWATADVVKMTVITDAAIAEKESDMAADFADVKYPRWLVATFPVSLAATVLGLFSAIYIVVAGFSITALAGSYLIPIGVTAIYFLLRSAERSADK
ncbi:MAG: hypothetical protein ACREFP_11105 [Acetobacteraceae bacterium]